MADSVSFVSPSPGAIGGFPDPRFDIWSEAPVSGGVADFSNLKPSYFPRKALKAGTAQMFRPATGVDLQINIRGLNVLIEHYDVVSQILPQMIWIIQNQAGIEMTAHAKRLIQSGPWKPAVDTGATRDSIYYDMTTTPTHIVTSVGPTTFYAPMIEYGFAEHAKYGPRPFMFQAMVATLPELIQAYVDMVGVVNGARVNIRSGPYRGPLLAFIHRWRKYLYTAEKAGGDIVPLGTGPGFSLISGISRRYLLGAARVLGDMQAALSHTVGLRFQRRMTGKITGRLIGLGSRTIFANTQYTSTISGGQRIYNRVAGRAVTKYVDQNKALSRFTGSR